MTETTVVYTIESEKVHSIRYKTEDKKAPTQTLYLSREWLDGDASLEVTVTFKRD